MYPASGLIKKYFFHQHHLHFSVYLYIAYIHAYLYEQIHAYVYTCKKTNIRGGVMSGGGKCPKGDVQAEIPGGNVHEENVLDPPSLFPLSCACARAHTGRKTRAHKKTWSAQKIIFYRNVLHIHVNVQKRLWTNNFLCAPYFFVVVVNVYRSRDFTRSRSLQTCTKSYFCIKLAECI